MNAQFTVAEGFLLDTRSVLLSTAAAFLGPIPGLIAATMGGIMRIYQGGAGALTGVIVIYVTTILGILFGKYRVNSLSSKKIKSYFELYMFGIITHISMLLCFFILPIEVATYVLGIITLPVLVLFPLITIPIGGIMMVQMLNAKNANTVEYLSKHDTLTGLYNRNYLEEEFESLTKNNNVGIIMGDVNGLKTFNDSYGHLVGDQLLVLIANILRQASPANSKIIRWGGDEFVIVISNASLLLLNEVCIKVKSYCNKESIQSVSPSISLGYSITSTNDFDKVFTEAEDLMYRNKLSESASTRSSIITSLENTLYERKYETEAHSSQMIKNAQKIGVKIGLKQNQLDELTLVAKLHDIGKIGISENILLKPGRLTKEEYEEVKKHSIIGYKILDSIDELKHISQLVLCHHERWDGTGYPNGFSKDDIPLLSRIVTVVDAYDAMTSGRIYQKRKSEDEAKRELQKLSGIQFDPSIVKVFLELDKTV